MLDSIRPGIKLPESLADFEALCADPAYRYLATRCVKCKKTFGEENTKTQRGWRETQISHLCETCSEGLWK